MDMKIYKEQVLNNKQYFDDLDIKMKKITKKVRETSKQFESSKVIDARTQYGNFNVQTWLQETITQVPSGINKEVVLWFVTFDYKLSDKISKDSFRGIVNEIKKQYGYKVGYYENAGLSFDYDYKTKIKTFVEDKTRLSSNRWYASYDPKAVITDMKKKRFELEEGFAYMYQNIEIFPTVLQEEIKKTQKNQGNVVKEVQNGFQYKLYLNSLPEKYTQTFIKNDIKRFSLKCKSYETVTKSNMLVIKAMIEKWGLQELMSNNYFHKIIYSSIIQRRGVEKFTQTEKDLVISPDMYKAMTTSMMTSLGFDQDYQDAQMNKEKA